MTKDENIATRQAFGETLYEIIKEDERVLALTADLGESLRMLKIREEMPERFLDTGVAEANMVGVAAGLAIAGYVPVAGTFSVFMTRAFDHIRLQVCQNNLHVVLVGSHGGVSNALDGGSANALEDIAYMRALPNMTVLYPSDGPEMAAALRAAVEADGPVFLRAYREPTPQISALLKAGHAPNDSGTSRAGQTSAFEIGKAYVHREGSDVTIAATGPQVAFALEAAETLASDGISAEVVGVPTIQPLDVETLTASAAKTGRVVTAEDHNVNGGLGSAVAEALGEHQPTPLRRVAVRQFGESGMYAELIAHLGIDAAGIVAAVQDVLEAHPAEL